MLDSAQPQVFLSSREPKEVPQNGTSGLFLPTAVMGVRACEMLGASTFNIGTLKIGEEGAPNEDGPVADGDDHAGDEDKAMADTNETAAEERGEKVLLQRRAVSGYRGFDKGMEHV